MFGADLPDFVAFLLIVAWDPYNFMPQTLASCVIYGSFYYLHNFFTLTNRGLQPHTDYILWSHLRGNFLFHSYRGRTYFLTLLFECVTCYGHAEDFLVGWGWLLMFIGGVFAYCACLQIEETPVPATLCLLQGDDFLIIYGLIALFLSLASLPLAACLKMSRLFSCRFAVRFACFTVVKPLVQLYGSQKLCSRALAVCG